jgi:tetratricopeptide (TPR) repeat protein
LLELGDAYFLQRDYDLAGRAYEGVLRLRPDDPTATVRLAMVWHAAGRPRRAMAAIEEALAAHPDDQEAHYSLAIVYFSEERLAEAREQWLAAARIDPRSELGRRSQSFVDLLDGDEPGESSGDG